MSSITAVQSGDTAVFLETRLLEDLRARSAQGANEHFTLELRDDPGALVGGLTASTSYGWLLIKVVWVAPDMRKQGHGTALIQRACDQGRELGCHSVWLDTSDAQAHAFYLALGFQPFGVLENGVDQAPAGHRRWFLKRAL